MKTSDTIKHSHRRNCRRSFTLLLIGAGLAIFLSTFCVLALQVFLITTPFRNRNIGTSPGYPYRDVTLTTADGLQISGWYVPGRRSEAIILVHGIHANRAFLIPQAQLLAEAGYPLLLIDLRGHGRSQGSTLTYGYWEALEVQAAADYLLSLPEINTVGALGHSLGGAAVVQAAARDDRFQAIVVQSSYSSLSLAVEEAYETFTLLPRWPFAPMVITLSEWRLGLKVNQIDSAAALATMPPRPVLVIHGAEDTLFKPHHAQMMYDAAQAPKNLLFIKNAGHINPIFGDEAAYKQVLLAFFDQAFQGSIQDIASPSP